ncbi:MULTISPECIES: inositol monophosphatase family protein [unclassified Caulobacter]|uniref:inositol monophosphatase family protein n=1 Tax=unclassified Caulobacter TaxID=2648921 RepID=UPI0009EB713D|nr:MULTISPECIES: inositol monophosphatase family protein [unclassified Caulobacter]
MSEPSPLLQTMIRAARAAGDRLKQDFAEIATLEIQHKNGPADPFTVADVRAEQTVKSILSEAYPDYGFLGEEGGLVRGADSSNTWICDPLDGTANFLIGLPIWAVNVALQRDGEVVAGVTYVPMLGELFRAETGGGAYLNDLPISVSKRQGLEQAVLGVGIPFMGKPRQEQFHAEMQRLTPKVSGVRRLGAGAVDMAYVACGRFDAYWEQSVSAWDMAAGAVIVREAGGVVTDTLGGGLDVMNGTVLATTPQIHDMLLHELRPV